jgi:hypothetical protein
MLQNVQLLEGLRHFRSQIFGLKIVQQVKSMQMPKYPEHFKIQNTSGLRHFKIRDTQPVQGLKQIIPTTKNFCVVIFAYGKILIAKPLTDYFSQVIAIKLLIINVMKHFF